ncbi:UDP-N-acetylmuramoyl-tripeptide--D-alanyl-D-alanine ligase [Magnetococcus marinus MC-1]|uniref:UDP-N-acetylmuramoyl-tripeptide--D-alanyl-D-alanine ligase n=1 Tax=Magnetococcus marinus (strain ATCC BAA-1437 / JCM 17883 / MC-1) TaxID=156889 RepID=A0L5N5_MAGMM|nr:UDP-N-acetylmuramoyl-tripeptide--D-alanyl-D-alanine ligase [Magnetococcus marinus]ABK43278.1 UDP-N-acetylmuramoyl-tripeptide--D-alanyl-D-alanine ligase [Magnetococcus marinus MC-1]
MSSAHGITPALLEQTLSATRVDAQDGTLPEVFHSLSSDTRSLQPGALFVALSGPNHDANLYVQQAVTAGASGILCSRPPAQSLPIPLWVVTDPLAAMTQLARAWRAHLSAKTIGITGSSGKTTVKEMLGLIVSSRYRTGITRGNLNNHIGLPLTLLNCPSDRTHLVLEMGMSAPGEIAHLAELAQPQIGIVTNILAAHVAGFGGGNLVSALRGIAHAKGELLQALPHDGLAVLPAIDPHLALLQSLTGCAILSFGPQSSGADVVFTPPSYGDDGMLSTLILPNGERFALNLPGFGPHLWLNAVAACAAAYGLGLDAAAMQEGLSRFKLQKGRGSVEHGQVGCRILNDTYNANVGAMRVALEALSHMAPAPQRIAVLGDMLELGEAADTLHAELAQTILALGIQRIFLAGPHMAALYQALQSSPGLQLFHYADPVALAKDLSHYVGHGDAVLVKGSRGMRMERVVEALHS